MKKHEVKNPAYEDQFIDWLLSNYQDKTQLLKPQELQQRLASINKKALINEENLFLVQSTVRIYQKQLGLNEQQEQKLIIIMLNFVEKAQKEQLNKIGNAHEIAGRVLLLTQGNANIANTIFRAILDSDSLINSNYLDNLILWLTSAEKDTSQLLTGKQLEKAIMNSEPKFTEIENKFLVRSLVFNLRTKS